MRLWTAALDLLFPPKCPYCHKVLDNPRAPLCPDCQVRLPWLTGKAGEKKVDFADGCFSPLAYQDRVREAIHRYKFQRVRACAGPFGAVMAQCMQDHLPQEIDWITWCPLHKKRLRERGFDQAKLLAQEVGRRLDIPVRATLRKDRNTRPQSELEEESARRANALGAYSLLPGTDLTGKRVVLVDDVVTTGSTLSECAALLRRAGAEKIFGLTLARARETGGGDKACSVENCKKK